ncbi:hypothetical protein C8R44DRAFT_906111 [Mycena epipterygia]|nr:hypothetical protein C8R44DRAFT_906111 [Mycena epipterygia]
MRLPPIPLNALASDVLDVYFSRDDVLANNLTTGRQAYISDVREFRAIVIGRVASHEFCPLHSLEHHSLMLLDVPDWSVLDWSSNFFEATFKEQLTMESGDFLEEREYPELHITTAKGVILGTDLAEAYAISENQPKTPMRGAWAGTRQLNQEPRKAHTVHGQFPTGRRKLVHVGPSIRKRPLAAEVSTKSSAPKRRRVRVDEKENVDLSEGIMTRSQRKLMEASMPSQLYCIVNQIKFEHDCKSTSHQISQITKVLPAIFLGVYSFVRVLIMSPSEDKIILGVVLQFGLQPNKVQLPAQITKVLPAIFLGVYNFVRLLIMSPGEDKIILGVVLQFGLQPNKVQLPVQITKVLPAIFLGVYNFVRVLFFNLACNQIRYNFQPKITKVLPAIFLGVYNFVRVLVMSPSELKKTPIGRYLLDRGKTGRYSPLEDGFDPESKWHMSACRAATAERGMSLMWCLASIASTSACVAVNTFSDSRGERKIVTSAVLSKA